MKNSYFEQEQFATVQLHLQMQTVKGRHAHTHTQALMVEHLIYYAFVA